SERTGSTLSEPDRSERSDRSSRSERSGRSRSVLVRRHAAALTSLNVEQLRSFDVVTDRDTWYAGSAVINGQRVEPPLGIRSITATADSRVLLANVHVGGVPR